MTKLKIFGIIHNSNEDLYTKLRLETVNYDIIFPTDYIIKRMIDNDVVQKLNIDWLPARKKYRSFLIIISL
ncbi:hypothetical protein [Brachyspira pulli]|uniref:hypothetical protein n=1 Tax=Brachyspira pulli TaxID=310721 RepID=UPI0030053060